MTSSEMKKKRKRRKPREWHVSAEEIAEIEKLGHEMLVEMYIAQREQINRFMRVIKKFKQTLVEMQALGQ